LIEKSASVTAHIRYGRNAGALMAKTSHIGSRPRTNTKTRDLGDIAVPDDISVLGEDDPRKTLAKRKAAPAKRQRK
jgi:hypothetical protein